VGWLFVALGLAAALQACSAAYGERVTLVGPGSLPAGWLANGLGGFLWPVNYLLFGLVLLLFPDGRLPSPRWRPVARLIVGSWCLSIIFNVLGPSEEHPGGLLLPQPALNLLTNLVNIAALAGLVVMMAAPFLRFRRASYQQRQQLMDFPPEGLRWRIYEPQNLVICCGQGCAARAPSKCRSVWFTGL
jgi:hypothetical protein